MGTHVFALQKVAGRQLCGNVSFSKMKALQTESFIKMTDAYTNITPNLTLNFG